MNKTFQSTPTKNSPGENQVVAKLSVVVVVVKVFALPQLKSTVNTRQWHPGIVPPSFEEEQNCTYVPSAKG